MIKVAVPGVNGRMGQAVVTEVMQSADMDLIVATARAGEQLGSKVAKSDVVVTNNISNSDFNVLIDFTLPMGVMEHLAFCREHKIAMVIGTTGFTDEQLVAIKNAAADIPIVLSSNMSVGVNICFKLLASASKMLSDQNWQMGIIDLHHEH
ncbi:MAG TPA: 4-hydroxy-tetrahydrodipicolinate reductase, partial [Gammaproteobacteria bacterium]|nr:4-hydroxy-tetrahydrodipicolinate reductase [Gammaproteobacteria bacterium]